MITIIDIDSVNISQRVFYNVSLHEINVTVT